MFATVQSKSAVRLAILRGSFGWRLAEPLTAVPNPGSAPRYADALRAALAAPEGRYAPIRDLRAICTATGMVIETHPLRGASGGIEATIAPLGGDRFHVVVDPEPPGGWDRIATVLRPDLQRQRFRFRLAHELGHSLFYERSGAKPSRRIPLTVAEEAFCDHFARALLLPDAALRGCALTPRGVLALQRRFDVSLETAVRPAAPGRCGQPL